MITFTEVRQQAEARLISAVFYDYSGEVAASMRRLSVHDPPTRTCQKPATAWKSLGTVSGISPVGPYCAAL